MSAVGMALAMWQVHLRASFDGPSVSGIHLLCKLLTSETHPMLPGSEFFWKEMFLSFDSNLTTSA